MTHTVQRLERAGLVIRRPDHSDRRATLVDSTPAGVALRRQVEGLWLELKSDSVGEITPAQQPQLLRRLGQLEANLGASTTNDGP